MEHLAEATFTVLVTPSTSIQGQWVAHCLNIDLVTQGDSIQHALMMAREALQQTIDDDLERGEDPLERAAAPDECWEVLTEIYRSGRPLATVTDERQIKAVVTLFTLTVPVAKLPEHARPPEVEMMPPIWQIAALGNLRNSQRASC